MTDNKKLASDLSEGFFSPDGWIAKDIGAEFDNRDTRIAELEAMLERTLCYARTSLFMDYNEYHSIRDNLRGELKIRKALQEVERGGVMIKRYNSEDWQMLYELAESTAKLRELYIVELEALLKKTLPELSEATINNRLSDGDIDYINSLMHEINKALQEVKL